MKTLFIITGANRGLGKALFDQLRKDQKVDYIVSISRSLSAEQSELINKGDDRFYFFALDYSALKTTTHLKSLEKFKDEVEKVVFISNAGTIVPIGMVGELDERNITESIQVNVTAPSIIVNFILKSFKGRLIDIVNISSGAAKRNIEGWSLYCSGKAFASMLFKTIELEAKGNSLLRVFEFDPGVIDTDMQKTIRTASAFPQQQNFIELSEAGKLQDVNDVAMSILSKICR
jgi:benzil reductase ((S)-benzoin forming)